MSTGPKWFLCFRPPSTAVDIDGVTDTDAVDCSADKVLTYLAAAAKQQKRKKEMNIKNKAATAATETENSTRYDGEWGSEIHPTKRRSFSGFVKAAFYRNALVRRTREKKSLLRRRSNSSLSESQSDRSDDSVVGDWKAGIRIYRIPAPEEEEGGRETAGEEAVRKEEKESIAGRRRRTSSGGRCSVGRPDWMFLMILLLTVLCGRLAAVVATTACVYVWVSRWRAAAAWKVVDGMTAARRRNRMKGDREEEEEEEVMAGREVVRDCKGGSERKRIGNRERYVWIS